MSFSVTGTPPGGDRSRHQKSELIQGSWTSTPSLFGDPGSGLKDSGVQTPSPDFYVKMVRGPDDDDDWVSGTGASGTRVEG